MKKKNIKKMESIFLTALPNNKNSQITLPKIETEKTTKLHQADVSKYLEETGLEQILSVTERGDDMETKRKLRRHNKNIKSLPGNNKVNKKTPDGEGKNCKINTIHIRFNEPNKYNKMPTAEHKRTGRMNNKKKYNLKLLLKNDRMNESIRTASNRKQQSYVDMLKETVKISHSRDKEAVVEPRMILRKRRPYEDSKNGHNLNNTGGLSLEMGTNNGNAEKRLLVAPEKRKALSIETNSKLAHSKPVQLDNNTSTGSDSQSEEDRKKTMESINQIIARYDNVNTLKKPKKVNQSNIKFVNKNVKQNTALLRTRNGNANKSMASLGSQSSAETLGEAICIQKDNPKDTSTLPYIDKVNNKRIKKPSMFRVTVKTKTPDPAKEHRKISASHPDGFGENRILPINRNCESTFLKRISHRPFEEDTSTGNTQTLLKNSRTRRMVYSLSNGQYGPLKRKKCKNGLSKHKTVAHFKLKKNEKY